MLSFRKQVIFCIILTSLWFIASAHAEPETTLHLEQNGLVFDFTIGEVDSDVKGNSNAGEAIDSVAADIQRMHVEDSAAEFQFETASIDVDPGREPNDLNSVKPKNFITGVVSKIRNFAPVRNTQVVLAKTLKPEFEGAFSGRSRFYYMVVRAFAFPAAETILLLVNRESPQDFIKPILSIGVLLTMGGLWADKVIDLTNNVGKTLDKVKALKPIRQTAAQAYELATSRMKKLLGIGNSDSTEVMKLNLDLFGPKTKVFVQQAKSLINVNYFFFDAILGYTTMMFKGGAAFEEHWWSMFIPLGTSAVATLSVGVFDQSAYWLQKLQLAIGKLSPEEIMSNRLGLMTYNAVVTTSATLLLNLQVGAWADLEGIGLLAYVAYRGFKAQHSIDLKSLELFGQKVQGLECNLELGGEPSVH